MVKTVFSVIVTGFALLILAGCNRTANTSNPREKLALAGAANLREAFNRGAGRQIFDDADEVFRISQRETDWLDVCGRMHKSLGWWKSFEARLDANSS
jgi:hypothetical protein